MTIKELILHLQEIEKLSGNLDIVMSKDGEGNSYSPCYQIYTGTYVPKTTWSGLLSDDLDQDVNCVVLFPTN